MISNEDILQVSLLCPDASEELIKHDLSLTRDVNTTVNRILDGNVSVSTGDSDDDLPDIGLNRHKRPYNSNNNGIHSKLYPTDHYSSPLKMTSSSNRKIPYSRNDFVSDNSSDDDIEMLEPPSLKDRLLGKSCAFSNSSSCNNAKLLSTLSSEPSVSCSTSVQLLSGTNSNKNTDLIDLVSNSSDSLDCVLEQNRFSKPSVKHFDEHSQSLDSVSTEETCSLGSQSSCLSDNSKPEKGGKRKRTLEEIEEKKKQALLKKEAAEKKKLERDKLQQEKKKNMQIRKLEGERKKQMGAWSQSLEFMKIVLDHHIINDCGLGAAIFKAGEELKVTCVTEEQGLPFTISWKRTVTDWVETGSEVESVKKESLEDEVLIVLPVADFVQMVYNSKQVSNNPGETTLLKYIQMMASRQQHMTLTPLVIGLEKYFRDKKTDKQRQHREAVLSTDDNHVQSKKKKLCHIDITRIDVEEACTEVQLRTGCVVQVLDSIEDVTDLVKTYTKAVAEKPSKKDRLTSIFSFHEDGSTGVKVDKSGKGLLKVWKQQLLQFKNVSPDIAEAIIAEYPSPQLLMKAYSRCTTMEDGIKLLDGIVVRRGAGVLETTRRIGKEMSRRFYLFFTSTNPDCVIK